MPLICFLLLVIRINLLEEWISLYLVWIVILLFLRDSTLGFLLGALLHDVDGLASCGKVCITGWWSEGVLDSLCSLVLCWFWLLVYLGQDFCHVCGLALLWGIIEDHTCKLLVLLMLSWYQAVLCYIVGIMIIDLWYSSHSLTHSSVYVWMIFNFIPLLIFLHIRLCCLNVVLLSSIPVELLRLELVAIGIILVIELLLIPH